jgi:subtilisin family serine protease
MVSFRYGGEDGREVRLVDEEDLVVVRTHRKETSPEAVPLASENRSKLSELAPVFTVAPAGVAVYQAPPGQAESLAKTIDQDPEVRFAGRGLRDEFGAAVVYTENLFVKFADGVTESDCKGILADVGVRAKRPLPYAGNAYFGEAEERTGRVVFTLAEKLLHRPEVELCHPELVREISWNNAFPDQWHLQSTIIGGTPVDAHANVTSAWEFSEGQGVVIAVIDDGVDIEHEEFATAGKVVAPRSMSTGSDDPRPTPRDHHGTACSGVACADGEHGASGVAPRARLMPIRLAAALGSQNEADAFAWAADNGADVISCSWGPIDGHFQDPNDPAHDNQVPLPDSTRLAIDYALSTGRAGKGCVITWAAGNGNEDVGNDGYASYDPVIAVAACNDGGTKSTYSDWGDAIWCCFPSDNLGGPSLTPGIWTTDRTGPVGYNRGNAADGDEAGNYTNSFGGTSSACPGVAGVVALMLAKNPELRPDEVKRLLRDSCDRIDDSDGEYADGGHSRRYGYGRVNAHAAVEAAATMVAGAGSEAS